MNAFADTNWLEAIYFKPHPDDKDAISKAVTVERRMRKHSGPLIISQIVLLEARNVFNRLSGKSNPEQWQHLLSDFNGRIFVDPMNWDLLRQETYRIFELFSHKVSLGSFDATLIASARLAGAREIMSFDQRLKAVSACLGFEVFPALDAEGRDLRAKLKN